MDMKINMEVKSEEFPGFSKQIEDIQRGMPSDRRKKEYKQMEEKIKEIEDKAKAIITKEAVKRMRELGYPFSQEGELGYPDKFRLYIIPSWHAYRYEEDSTGSFTIYDRRDTKYSSGIGNTTEEIEEAHKKYIEYVATDKVNKANAKAVLKAVGKVTYKGWNPKGEEWNGTEFRIEYDKRDDKTSYEDKGRIECTAFRKEISVRADIRKTFEHPGAAASFIKEVQELIARYSDLVFQEEKDM